MHVITWHYIKFPLHFNIPTEAFMRFSFGGKVECFTKPTPQISSKEIKTLVLGRHERRCWLRRKSNLTFDKTQWDQNVVVHFSVGRTDRPTDVMIAGAYFEGQFLTFIVRDFRAPQKTTVGGGKVSNQNKTGGFAVTV